MTKEQKETIDTIVKAYKTAAEKCNLKIEVDDYETFIKNNPDADNITINIKIIPTVKSIPIEFIVDGEK